jgi:uncharacterized C2H2 Zn-finger protein
MVQYKCDKCDKIFKQKIDFQRHLDRKRPCNFTVSRVSHIDIGRKVNENVNSKNFSKHQVSRDKKYMCYLCSKEFGHKSSLSRHKNERCIYLDKTTKDLREELINQKKDSIKIINNHVINNYNNNISYTNNNLTNIINTIPFGKENLDFITDDQWIQFIRFPYNALNKMIELVHFNKDHPEHHNVYISDLSRKHAMIYNGKIWKKTLKNPVIEKLINKYAMEIIDKHDQFIESNKLKKKHFKFEKFVDNYLEEKLFPEYKHEIEELLYNFKKELDTIKD